MIIENHLNTKTKSELLKLSFRLKASDSDKQRSQICGEYYAMEVAKIRHYTKRELVEYIADKKQERGVKLGLKVAKTASTKIYRMLDSKVREDIELMNYARNRLYSAI